MNITICIILVVIAILEVGQAITLNKKINLLNVQIKHLKRTTKGIDIDILDNHMKICSLTGKCEEINQRSKEGFEKLGYDLLETQKNVGKLEASVRQESAKNIMLHVRGE